MKALKRSWKLSERKRGGNFVEIRNETKAEEIKNEALQQIRRGFSWKLSAIFLKNIGNYTQGFQ
jgi:thermostable 8-oxoguanine DNA glycosylase